MEQCPAHIDLCNDLKEVKDNTQRIVAGLYGKFEEPNTGFINNVKSEIALVKKDVADVKSIYTDIKNNINKFAWAVIGIILTGIGSIVVASIQGCMK